MLVALLASPAVGEAQARPSILIVDDGGDATAAIMPDHVHLVIRKHRDSAEEMIQRQADWPMDTPLPLYSGDRSVLVEGSYDQNGRVRYVSDRPLPAIVAASVSNIEVDMGDA